MRQILSTALVAVIVGALAGVTASALAQTPEAEAISPSAVSNINAHRVDGKHAVGYTTKASTRAGKLVATNKTGKLPSNIVDPFWGGIKNVPAGFADGVDDAGVTGIDIKLVMSAATTVAIGAFGSATATCPSGYRTSGGGFTASALSGFSVAASYPTPTTWYTDGTNTTGSPRTLRSFALCMSVTPSAALTTSSVGKLPSSIKKRSSR